MKLRTKALLNIGMTLAGLLAISFAIVRFVLSHGYAELVTHSVRSKESDDSHALGLIEMRERVHHLKGNLKVVSNFPKGTTIIATAPLQ